MSPHLNPRISLRPRPPVGRDGVREDGPATSHDRTADAVQSVAQVVDGEDLDRDKAKAPDFHSGDHGGVGRGG
jgi:hypothetical protein